MTDPTCGLCGKPVTDNAYVCDRWRCAGGLEQVLAEIPALAAELDTTVAKLDHLVRVGRPDPADVLTKTDRAAISQVDAEASVHIQGLPYSPHASTARDELRTCLVGWVRVVVDERGSRWPLDTLAAMSAFLHSHLEWLRHQPFATETVPAVKQAAWRAWGACDRPQDRVYAGPCDVKGQFGAEPCQGSLYARVGAEKVECEACGLVWDVTGRREFLLEAAEAMLVTAAEMSRFLTVYGEPVSGERIRKWAQRGQLVQHGADERGHPLYRVGEATGLLAQMSRRSA